MENSRITFLNQSAYWAWFMPLLCACIFPGGVTAAEYPTIGLLYSTQEVHSMRYDCQKNRDNTLACEFVQVSVVKESKPEALEDKLNQSRKEFRKSIKFSEDECHGYSTALDVLAGREKLPELEAMFAGMSNIEKDDTAKLLRAMAEFCKAKTEDNWLNITRLMHDKETRTCEVRTNPYKQNFVLVRDPKMKAETWVVKQEKPEGPCGMVQLSRFEAERESGIVFWKYIARRAITNPQGKYMGTMPCKDFDETEFVYDWRSKNHTLGCDYIKFNAF